MDFRKWWLGTCVATVMGQGYVDTRGYAPGTCTDQYVPVAGQAELKPCTPEQSGQSIRSRRHRRSYGGK
jgi:hypothetical protein